MLVPRRLVRREPVLEISRRLKIGPEVLFPLLQRLLPRLRGVDDLLPWPEELRRRAAIGGLRLDERRLSLLTRQEKPVLVIHQAAGNRVDLQDDIRHKLLM